MSKTSDSASTDIARVVETIAAEYRAQAIDRRGFLTRLIAVTGSMGAAHLLLESNGMAATLLSDAESQKAKVTSTAVSFPEEAKEILGGYLSAPEGKGPFPAVLVIHENRGLNEHTRDVARRFAAEGFVALAPDALARSGGTGAMKTPDEARAAIGLLTPEQAISDLRSALRFLDAHPAVQKGKLGVVGFCWGGARSFTLATQDPRLRGSVVFYGTAPSAPELAKTLCPVLGLYGETDERITSRVPETTAAMKAAGKKYESKIYAGAGHAFFNDTGERYNAAAASDAWTRTLAFFRANLR
ncbi:MAG: dienelactone hydrolase family protein [Cytophagales bacterium]|nr:dienelactone hydrolase family protein [Armatimonadota bacterium]